MENKFNRNRRRMGKMNRLDIIKKHSHHFDKVAKAEYNSQKVVVEEKQQRSLNELYFKLMQMGQLNQAVGRQAQFHGNRAEVLSMVERGEVEENPMYMEDTKVMEHLQRAKKTFEDIDLAKDKIAEKRAEEILSRKNEEMIQKERIAYLDNMMKNGGSQVKGVDTK